MDVKFIINPASGKLSKDSNIADRITRICESHGIRESIAYTEAPLHATELAADAHRDGFSCIVSVGGDGTMNEVAKGLVHTDSVMALVPCGSGNGLGRHLGIVGSLQKSIRIVKEGVVKAIDTGAVNGIPFFNVMGMGFDAKISERFNPLKKRGFSNYIKVGLQTFMDHKPKRYQFWNGAEHVDTDAWMVSVANSAQFGNNAYIAPGAKVDDGLLDLTCLNMSHLASAIPLSARLFMKNIDRSPKAITMQGESFTISREKAEIIHVDGEVHTASSDLMVTTHPKSLKIMIPQNR